ncbi:MAG: VWA domain-containing protein [Flavobacteriales bacterium]|nr:VWA domain-containing protein [Flavobacteriales bacterium]|tara:strand:+ start:531 stop:1544 length:1014 start_codon:yes stop_codon:yes gene_type:complete
MNLLNNITFNNPELFLLLILPLVHALWHFFSQKNTKNVLSFSNITLFSSKKIIKERLRHLPYLLQILSICLIITSLARPQTNTSWEESKTEGIDIIISMDISGSMLAQDLKPNRLDASKKIATDFIKQRKNDRIGLVIFSGRSFTQCPLTTDKTSVVNLFNDIKYGMIDDGRTAIGDGLGTALNRLKGSKTKSKIVILLTDGENTTGKISPLTAADIAASDSMNVKVYTIGVGTKGMARSPVAIDFNGNFVYDYVEVKIDEQTLTEIANKTGGRYFRATNNASLKGIYNTIDELETSEIESVRFNTTTEKFYLFSLSALGVFLLSFILKITYFRGIN